MIAKGMHVRGQEVSCRRALEGVHNVFHLASMPADDEMYVFRQDRASPNRDAASASRFPKPFTHQTRLQAGELAIHVL